PGSRVSRPARAVRGPPPAVREALRQPLAGDPRRSGGVRGGRSLGRVSVRRVLVRDGRRGAGGVRRRGGACQMNTAISEKITMNPTSSTSAPAARSHVQPYVVRTP